MPPVSGWYPDPTGRFEFRYHNDAQWTSDVASGGQRFVDPSPVTGAQPPTPRGDSRAPAGRNGLATAALVLGIIATTTSWVPFVGVVGLICGIVGLCLAIPAVRRSTPTGDRRGAAIAGTVTSACGIVFGVLGIFFTVALYRAVDRYEHPGSFTERIITCTADDGSILVTGEIENRSSRTRDYTLTVALAPGLTQHVTVDDVAAGDTGTFSHTAIVDRFTSVDTSDCRITAVNGPVPFGLDPSIFD